MERMHGPRNTKRIRGGRPRTSSLPTTKSISAKAAGRKSDGRVQKTIGLTPGVLDRVSGRRRAMTPETDLGGNRVNRGPDDSRRRCRREMSRVPRGRGPWATQTGDSPAESRNGGPA